MKKRHILLMAILSLAVVFFVPQSTQAATTRRPAQVTSLSVKLTAKNTAKITWKKASNAKSYQLYCSVNGGSYKKIKTTKSTSYTHKKLKSGATYVYKVRGVNQKKTGNYSSVQRIRILSASKTGLSTSVNGTVATLKWNKVTNATGYWYAPF
nr:fibronectin type III domain-containing protein [uncultured Anaerobutyricum sp.]